MARKKVALILSGGGARGAYQAGILSAWSDIFARNGKIEILSGVSAGSINAVRMAQSAPYFASGVEALDHLWSSLTTDQVFDSDLKTVLHNLASLLHSSRGIANNPRETITHSLLHTNPLKNFLSTNIDMGQVHHRLRTLPDLALAVSCFDYTDLKSSTFFETKQSCPSWERPTLRGVRTELSIEHVLASCSVPLVFPTVKIDGHFYGDGSMRNMTPLNPAIKLGADRIISISLRGDNIKKPEAGPPSMGWVASTLLDSMFLDAVEVDSQVMNRINMIAGKVPEKDRDAKIIDLCRVTPTVDFGAIAHRYRKKFPRTLRWLFGGWINRELLSYLLFDQDYTQELIELGRRDGHLFHDLVEEWLLEQ